MASSRLIAKEAAEVYAGVLTDAALSSGGQEAVIKVRSQLDDVVGVMYVDMDLEAALSDSQLSPEQRRSLAQAVFAGCDPAFSEVLAFMAEHGDFSLLPRVKPAMDDAIEEKLNLVVADVTTAVPLDDHLRQVITNKVETDLGKNVVLNERVDKSILGGIILSVRGWRMDASMVSQLNYARGVLGETPDGGES